VGGTRRRGPTAGSAPGAESSPATAALWETSGKYLDYRGFADLRAPRGKAGTLLLDPTNIYIAVDQLLQLPLE